MKKAVIGVVPLYDSEKNSFWMLPEYLYAVENSGGIPLTLPLAKGADIKTLFDMCDGFLFTGGQDISPSLYGETAIAQCGEACAARDCFEKELLRLAVEEDKPVFGICRGIQFMNAALGGTLWQDLPLQYGTGVEHHMSPPYEREVHKVTLAKNSPLYALLGQESFGVNSYHHQAVKELAPCLCETARSEDGLTEGVYYPGKRFIWAVQWHPELSFKTDEKSRKIFKCFIDSCLSVR